MNRYQICFDLFTDKKTEQLLKTKYNKSLSCLYDTIKKYFKCNDFSWIQGSVYYSNKYITNKVLDNILKGFLSENLWITEFIRDMRITIIEELTYD